MAGVHRSAARGGSLEFAQHREYAPGDDPRYVDWKAFARTDRLQLKQFEDETNLVFYLVVDVSASMNYRGPGAAWSKRDFAISLAAAAAWLALANHDAVSLTLAGSEDALPGPPSMNAGLFLELTKRMQAANSKQTEASPLTGLAGAFRRRGILLLLTDALSDTVALQADLGRLSHQEHEIRMLQILDDAEINFPFSQAASFQDLETGAIVPADPLTMAQAYREEIEAHLQQVKAICAARRAAYQLVRTSDSLEGPLRFLLSGDHSRSTRSLLARSR